MSIDINKYLNSQDIAEHCKSINHTFNPLEKAIVIAMSFRPVQQRLDGYRALLPEAEDSFFSFKWMKCDEAETRNLGIVLRDIIEYEACILNFVRCAEKGAMFQAGISYGCGERHNALFCSFENALDFLKKARRDDSCSCEIEKTMIGSELCGVVSIYPDGTILSAYANIESKGDICSELDLTNAKLRFHIPTPFHPGDILELRGEEKHSVYVLISLDRDMLPNKDKNQLEFRSTSDMFAIVYSMNHEKLMESNISPYTDLCYFRGELPPRQRRLKFVSRHLKGEFDVTGLMNSLNIS